MSKKIKVLALAALSAAFLALPAMASAQEIHFEPAEAFNITGAGGVMSASGEPNITCYGTSGSGKFDTGSTTTGVVTLDFTQCHMRYGPFGPFKCRTETVGGADNTIATSGAFHLITISPGVPGVLLTTNAVTVNCGGIFLTTTGSVIGTITSPKCGESSKTLTLSFTATSGVQNHLEYTGSKFDLVSKTGSGENRTSALEGTATNTQANAGKLNCT